MTAFGRLPTFYFNKNLRSALHIKMSVNEGFKRIARFVG